MSDKTEGEVDLDTTGKFAFGAVNLTASAAAAWRFEALRTPAGMEEICILFAAISVVVGTAAAFRAKRSHVLLNVLLLAAATSAAFYYAVLMAKAGLNLDELWIAVLIFVGVAGVVAYLLATGERIVGRHYRAWAATQRS